MELKWAQTEMQEVSLKMRNDFFTVKVTEHGHRFLRGVMESASLEIFKSHLYIVLGNHLWVALLEHGSLDQMAFRTLLWRLFWEFVKVSKVISRID